ncbi:hypothetical protein BDR07DRAFT_936656 [Suillus spraguei]|nr:hypothetical protein BDR07DRAFT_936656 [Suillus spraguei]
MNAVRRNYLHRFERFRSHPRVPSHRLDIASVPFNETYVSEIHCIISSQCIRKPLRSLHQIFVT